MFDNVILMLESTDFIIGNATEQFYNKLDMAYLVATSANPYPTRIREEMQQFIVNAIFGGLVALGLWFVVVWMVNTVVGMYQAWGVVEESLLYEIPVVSADEVLCDEGGYYALLTVKDQQVKYYHNPAVWNPAPTKKNVLEAYLPGSSSTPAKEPAYALHFHSNGRVLGQSFRWANYVVLPSHVLHTLQQVTSEKGGEVKIVHGNRSFPLPRGESLRVVCDSGELDLAAFQLPESVFTNLQVKRANLAYIPEFSAVSTIFTIASKGSWNMAIVPLERAEGRPFEFSHTASTYPGNSGAPIVIGGKVVGFHSRTCDGKNYGRSIAVLKDLESLGEESLSAPAKKRMFGDWETDFRVDQLDERDERRVNALAEEEYEFEFGGRRAVLQRINREVVRVRHDEGYDSAEEELMQSLSKGSGRVSARGGRNESATMTDPAILSAKVALANQLLNPSEETTSPVVAVVTEKARPKETLAELATSVKKQPTPPKKVTKVIKTATDLAVHEAKVTFKEEAAWTDVKSKAALKRERLQAKIRAEEVEKLANDSSFPQTSPKQADKEVHESCKTPVPSSGKKTEKSTASSKKLGHVSRSGRETPSEEVLATLFDLLKQSGVSEKTFKRLLEAKRTKSEVS
jgi:hypothetical protein